MILDYLLPLYNLSGLVFVPGRGWNKRTPWAQRLSGKSLTRTLLFSIALHDISGKKKKLFFLSLLKGSIWTTRTSWRGWRSRIHGKLYQCYINNKIANANSVFTDNSLSWVLNIFQGSSGPRGPEGLAGKPGEDVSHLWDIFFPFSLAFPALDRIFNIMAK